MKAASAHHSQLTDLIRDDPNGCRLPAQVLAQFEQRWEFLFFSQMTQSLMLATASVRRLRPAVLPVCVFVGHRAATYRLDLLEIRSV
jgi:hypothetical protein